MDFVDRLVGQRWNNVRLDTFLKLSNLEVPVQRHLQRVYATLTVSLAITALGAYMDMVYGISGFLTSIGAFGCLLGLVWTPSSPATLNKRYGLLAGWSFCQGAALGRLVGLALAVDPSIVLTAALGTCAVFVSFTLAALLSARRSWLYLGGLLSSAVLGMMALRFGSLLLGGRQVAFSVELYGGLLVFAGYVLFDTQLIVEKAAAGYTDHVKAALDLQVDLLAIFARVLIILINNKAKREEQERRRRSSSSKTRRD